MEPLFWYWLALGFGLLVLEMFLPTGFVLIWIGAAALIVGALAWLAPGLGWQVEVVLFAIGSVASFFAWKRLRPVNLASDQPTLNRRGHSYVGRTFTLSSAIENGVGTLHVDDSQWRIAGVDTPAGTQVRVIAAEGATLRVERV